MTVRFLNLLERNQLVAVGIIWILVQSALFYIYGINPILESLKYIGAAHDLLSNGELPESRYFFYLTTTLIIACCLKTGLGFTGVVFIQLMLNLFATLTFFRALRENQQKKFSAFLTVFLLCTFLPYQTWNFYLYTESVFYSCALLFFSTCLYYKEVSKRTLFIQGLFLLLTIISRPLGIVFLPCWILFIALKKKINSSVLIIIFFIAISLAIIVSNTIMANISDWQILKSAEYGYIICDMPARTKMELDYLKRHAPLTQLSLFIMQHPAEFFSLCLKRLNAFILLSRNYYSTAHNIYLLAYAALFTIPFIANLFLFRKKIVNKPAFFLCFFIVAGFCCAVALQCDDYHNRFHHAIIPILLYGGAFFLVEKYGHINTKK